MEKREFELLSRETCYDGFFRLERIRLRHSLHAGGMSPVLSREVVERADVAAVLLYDPRLDRVMMIEHFVSVPWPARGDRGCSKSWPA